MSISRSLPPALGLSLLLLAAAGCAPRRVRTPDIVLITVDTLRADHLGAYGYSAARTPAIDSLAAEGTLFERAYTPTPRTTPGLASLLTGLEPHRHGSREVATPVTGGTLLSELLGGLGYATASVTASGVAGPNENLDRGFDRFVVINQAEAEQVTDRALQEAAALPADRPRFLWVHYWDPHTPYSPPSPWGDVPEGGLCRELHDDYYTRKVQLGAVFGDRDGVASRALESCRALYDSDIAYTDHHIGRLLAGLESTFALADGITLFTSDHGENLGEDGVFYEHGPSLHEAATVVPLIWRGGGFGGGRDERVVGLVDVLPTLLESLAVPESAWPAMDGASLHGSIRRRALFAEGASALQVHHFERLQSGRLGGLHCINGDRYSLCGRPEEDYRLFDHRADPLLERPLEREPAEVRQRLAAALEAWPIEEARERGVWLASFKLVEKPLLDGTYESWLFDLENDPLATRNVIDAHPDEAAKLRRALVDWHHRAEKSAPVERDEDAVRRLRAMGYTG